MTSPTTTTTWPVSPTPAPAAHTLPERPEYPLLDVRDLSISYHSNNATRARVDAVTAVNLTVYPGQVTALVGESGSGKSTTAHAVIGLLPDNALIGGGDILFQGQVISVLDEQQLTAYRGPAIGFIPQDPANSLNPTKTIGANLREIFDLHPAATRALGISDITAECERLLARVGIDQPAQRLNQYPHQLSGGMQQRVLIAAALALRPKLIIADEPTSALDVTVQRTVLDLLDDLAREYSLGVLLITHDLAVAADRANQIVVMQHGHVREQGLTAAVFSNPQDPYTRQLIADAPAIAAMVAPTAPTIRQPHTTPAVPANTPQPAPLLEVDHVAKYYGDFTAVDHVHFTVESGTTHAIVGESGSGKSTLAKIIAGFTAPSQGQVLLHGNPTTINRDFRRQVQLVAQHPLSALNPRRTIGQSIAEPLQNLTNASKAEIRERVAHMLSTVALDPALAKRKPRELSGGQRQRVVLARALVIEPELVVLDEAVSALDVTVQARILDLLQQLQESLQLTYVFISHDLAVVRQIADTVSVIGNGIQVEHGPIGQVFQHPQAPLTTALLEAIPGRGYTSGAFNLGL
ncbi:dipeptide ABC transporter ATP-binding protein [Corynebacterium choanae]|uniref:Glutathione import ATP-binding protein GsiA n=1 Tax=Corynebacterium choanae TaxID=1862358 RepID=A0A3G6J715_9CORY|nr:ABC transporter ATP-binding protein [Corynebacterium choanae]AZA12718.1 Glutathione import ATP-binding protein GsiA [Corynebacterium choanae]